jgi:hypothetical protein
MDENQVFGWDDIGVAADDVSFEALPEGEYDFEVRGVKNQRYEKKRAESKIPDGVPCANVQLYCRNEKAAGTVFDKLYLYGGGMGRVTTYFKACGLIPVDMPANAPLPASFKSMFDQSVTTTGRVKVTVREYTQDGQKYKGNNVRYILPDAQAARPATYQQPQQQSFAPQPPQPSYQPPQQQSWGAQPPQQPPQQPQQRSWGGSWG